MSATPFENLQDALIAAENSGVARKTMGDNSPAMANRVHRIIAGEVDDLSLNAAVRIINSLPPAFRESVVKLNHPWLNAPARSDLAGAPGLIVASSLALAKISEMVSTLSAAAADGKVTPEEQNQIRLRIIEAKAELDKLSVINEQAVTHRPARR